MRCRQEPFLLEPSSCSAQGGAGTSQGNRHFQTSWVWILTPDGPVSLGRGDRAPSLQGCSERSVPDCWVYAGMMNICPREGGMLLIWICFSIHPHVHLSPPLQHRLFP